MRFLIFMLVWLLGSVVAHAQGFGQSLPFLAKDVATRVAWTDPAQSQSLYAWWNYSDATNGIKLSTTNIWYDRVSSKEIAPPAVWSVVYSVTNTSQGFYWGSDRTDNDTTNSPIAAGTNQSLCLVFHPFIKLPSGNELWWSPWTLADAVQGVAATHGGISRETSGALSWGTGFTGGPSIANAPIFNFPYEVVLVQSNTLLYCYTNGVLSTSFSRTPPSPDGYAWFYFMGDKDSAAISVGGYVKEALLWSTNLSVAQVSNVHHYITNLYSKSGFAPTNFPNCWFWGTSSNSLDAAANPIADGVRVSRILDKGGLTNNFYAPVVGPYYSNALSAAVWSSSELMYMTNINTVYNSVPQPNTMFFVARDIPNGRSRSIIDSQNLGARQLLAFNATDQIQAYAGSSLVSASGDVPSNSWAVVTVQFNGATTIIRTNGNLCKSGNANTHNPANGLALGNDSTLTTNSAYHGLLREVIVYNSYMSSNDMRKVETWLGTRWGITIP